jgi:hypothetical protein
MLAARDVDIGYLGAALVRDLELVVGPDVVLWLLWR